MKSEAFFKNAKIAQLVEHHLAKVEVAGSNPVFRSTSTPLSHHGWSFFLHTSPARVVELVDTPDLKSCGHFARAGSSPASSTEIPFNHLVIRDFYFSHIRWL